MKIVREPLFHFLLAGVALFILFSAVNRGQAGPGASDSEIVVSEGRIYSFTQKFMKVWQRPPNSQELEGLIQGYVREEIYYREALSMGLDVGDEIVRRRMAQKLEFISEDIASLQEPTDAELRTYFESHKEKFRREAVVTFQHVYLNSDKRGESTLKDADSLLAKLRERGGSSEYAEMSDPSMLSTEFSSTTQREVASLFGEEFTTGLLSQTLSQWSGPIESAYGLHLVFVSDRIDGEIPPFDEVSNIVVREWTSVKKKETKDLFYDSLLKRYKVTIEKPDNKASDLAQLDDGAGR
jgi:hypothetical protein